jgi:HK97 family phage prohead protease
MNKQREQLSIATELRVQRSENGQKTISGLIPYNSPSVDLGGFTEILAEGCFSAALEANSDVLALRDHDAKLLLGRTKSKTLALTDSPEGLRYTISLPDTSYANDLAVCIDRGDLDATSFGFQCLEDKWLASSDGSVVRTVIAAELAEVSPCSFPAYPGSAVSVRSCPQELRSKLTKRDDGMAEETDSVKPKDADDCNCVKDANGDCTCPDDNEDDDIDVASTRNYMEMTLALINLNL